MPIEGPASFLPTTDEFSAHWGLVNTALAPAALVLPAGTTRANLETHRTSLATLHAAVQTGINDVEMARADLDDRKAALHTRLTQFNEKARSYLSTTTLARALPKVPTLSEGQGAWLPVFDDMENLWTRANALAPVGGDGDSTIEGKLARKLKRRGAGTKSAARIKKAKAPAGKRRGRKAVTPERQG